MLSLTSFAPTLRLPRLFGLHREVEEAAADRVFEVGFRPVHQRLRAVEVRPHPDLLRRGRGLAAARRAVSERSPGGHGLFGVGRATKRLTAPSSVRRFSQRKSAAAFAVASASASPVAAHHATCARTAWAFGPARIGRLDGGRVPRLARLGRLRVVLGVRELTATPAARSPASACPSGSRASSPPWLSSSSSPSSA